MFWRFAPGYSVDPDVPEQMADAFEIRKQFDFPQSVRDIGVVIRFARAATGGGKVGIVDYCMGGGMAYLAATRTDVDASVAIMARKSPLTSMRRMPLLGPCSLISPRKMRTSRPKRLPE